MKEKNRSVLAVFAGLLLVGMFLVPAVSPNDVFHFDISCSEGSESASDTIDLLFYE